MSAGTGKAGATVKERADLALNNDFLRKAVRFTTERLRGGKKKAAAGPWQLGGMAGARQANSAAYDRSSRLLLESVR